MWKTFSLGQGDGEQFFFFFTRDLYFQGKTVFLWCNIKVDITATCQSSEGSGVQDTTWMLQGGHARRCWSAQEQLKGSGRRGAWRDPEQEEKHVKEAENALCGCGRTSGKYWCNRKTKLTVKPGILNPPSVYTLPKIPNAGRAVSCKHSADIILREGKKRSMTSLGEPRGSVL